MTFPSSGAVSLNAFADEVGDSDNVHSMSEFYRKANGPVYDAPDNSDIPSDTTQPIKFSQLRGTTAVAFRSVSEGAQDNNQGVNTLSKFFNSTDRANKYCKLTVDADVIATTNQGSIQAGPFTKGLYIEFTGNDNIIAGGAGTKGNNPLWNDNNNEAAANQANPGNQGGTGLTVSNVCAFVKIKDANHWSNSNANSRIKGGGGGPGSGGAYNRGTLGTGQNRNNPVNGSQGYYNFGGLGSMENSTFNINYNVPGGTMSWNIDLSSSHNVGNVTNNYIYANNGNPGTYNNAPIGAAGNAGGPGQSGNDGSNTVNKATPNAGNDGNVGQYYNWNPPGENLYFDGNGIGVHNSNNSQVFFPLGNPNSPLRANSSQGMNIKTVSFFGSNTRYAFAVSRHYGYPTFAIFREWFTGYENSPNYYYWFKSTNVGNNPTPHPAGHLQLEPPGTGFYGTEAQAANNGSVSNVLNPASAGGPPGNTYHDPNNRISTGDLDPDT